MSFTNMDSKEANVESAPAYLEVIPRNSLRQTQIESMGSPRRRGADEEEESQRNQIDSDKEPTSVKRNPKPIATKLQLTSNLNGSERQKEPFHGDGKTKKSKPPKHKIENEKSQDESGSLTVSEPLSRTPKGKTHTKHKPSYFLGSIKFKGFNGLFSFDALKTPSKYVRCAPNTKADTIWNLMINKWHMERPKLIISVTGGAQWFDMKRIIQKKFKRFIEGIWIITEGTTLVHAVKDNFTLGRKNDVVVLGVAPWGCVANRQALEGEEGQRYCSSPKEYSYGDVRKAQKSCSQNVPLNANHSHFILIDDGTENKFGGEIDFRTSLERFISKQSVDPDDKKPSRTIPVISIIVDGDINTMKMMWKSVINRIPVLVLQSSGGAADFIALGYNITTNLYNQEESFFPITFDEDMKEFAWEVTNLRRKPELVDNCLKQLRKALQHRELLTVYYLNDNETEEIDRAILYALLKANRSDINAKLSLTLAWNRLDIAKNEIFKALKKTNSQNLELYDAMMTALVQDRPEFVKLFLENGIHLNEFFDIEILWELYLNCFNDENNASARLLMGLMKKSASKRIKGSKMSEVGLFDVAIFLSEIGDAISDLFGNEKMTVVNKHLCNPATNLFIWAVLMNRMGLAKLFWRIGEDNIETALFASCMLKKLSKRAYNEDELELSLTYTRHSSEFEKLASEILGICYLQNRDKSHQLLVRELYEYGHTTLFFLAEENRLMYFLGQTCCQTKLSAIWKGRMAQSTSLKRIVASIIMPLLIFFITFVDEKDLRDTRKDSPLTKRGLNGKVDPISHIESKDDQNGCCLKWCYGINAKFYAFYNAPVIKFITAMFANIVFLGLFSFFVLTDLHPIGENGAPSLVEIFIWTYTITSVIEEIRQVLTIDYDSIWFKIRSWSGSAWNCFDFVLYLFFLTSVILRFLLYGEDFIWVRMLYSLTLGMYFFRFLQYFDADQNIGPKVTMISRMLTDLMFFLLILLVFILSFGVTYQANLYPNAPQQWSVLKDVLYHPYWQMYGELFLENLEGTDPSEEAKTCTKNETLWRSGEKDRCPEKSTLVVLLMVVYMLLTNVLLLNLLIALFSDTIKKVHDNSEKEWRFNRFSLVYEYTNRPFLFPPLSLLIYMYWLIRRCFKRLCRRYNNKDTIFKKDLKWEEHIILTRFEREAMEEYMDSELSLENDKIAKKIQTSVQRVDRVNEKVDKIEDRVNQLWRHQFNRNDRINIKH